LLGGGNQFVLRFIEAAVESLLSSIWHSFGTRVDLYSLPSSSLCLVL
jgi:hypothetical protein